MDLLKAFSFYSENPEAKYAKPINVPLGNATYSGNIDHTTLDGVFDWGTLLGKAVDTGLNIYQAKKLSDYGYPIGQSSIQANKNQAPVRIDIPLAQGQKQTGLSLPNSVGSIMSGINPTYLIAGLFIVLIFIMKRSG